MTAIRTSKTRARLSRRAFLRSVGASAALVPLLEVSAHGATSPYPKRLITIAWSNGVAQPSFYPSADDPTANVIMQPLAPLKAKVTLVAGLDYKTMLDAGHAYDGHFSFPTMFTGTYTNLGGQNNTATGPSVDQVVSIAVAKTVNLPVPLLTIAAAGNSTSFRAGGVQNTAETQVGRLFTTLFANQAAGGGMSSPQASALQQRRKSVIDYLLPELTTFSARRGTDDQTKIAAHLDSIRQLEKSLTAAAPAASCMAVSPGSPSEYSASVKAFSDLVAMALRCDVTRTVAITWAADGGSGPGAMPFLNIGADNGGGLGDVHAIAHQGPAGYAKKIVIDTWYMKQLAYLATALDGTLEGAGTVLDNSLIVMGNDMSEGAQHANSSIPFILVGKAGGALKSGRVVKVGTWAAATGNYWTGSSGVPHNHLLASISNLMDVPATSFGTGYAGTLTEIA